MDDDGSSRDEHDGSDAGAGGCPNAFTILYEKALSQQVVLGCWCPTMDLLALVSDDGQLGVHRLEWQKLWVACPDAPITALCWRPDGKVLATGHRHGDVSLYNVEACELFRTLRAPRTAPVCHLSWVQGIPPSPATATPALHLAYRYRHMRFFPAPAPTRGSHGAAGAPGGAGGGGGGARTVAPGQGGGRASGGASASAAGGGNGAGAEECEWPPPPDSLDVLVSSDTAGGVSLMACGEVLVAALPPREGAAEAAGTGAAAAAAAMPYGPRGELPGGLQSVLSRDMTTLMVLSEPDSQAAGGGGGDGGGATPTATEGGAGGGGAAASAASAVLSVYHCGKLGSCQGEILELSLLGGLVAGRLDVAQAALGAAARAWRGAAAELNKRLDEQLREALESHGYDPDDVVGELTCMLASGHVSPPLQSFLTNTLTEPGLRRLAKTVDLAVQEVSSQLLEGVLPALQLVAFVVGELKGRARAAHITQTLGLHERSVAVAEVEAAKALVQLEALRQLVTRVGSQYRTFFTWLLKTLQGLEEARPEGEDGPLPGSSASAGSLAGAPSCTPTLLAFLGEGGQFGADAVARDLDASPATLGLPVGSLRYPPHLLPHLQALQEAAFPLPPPEKEAAAAAMSLSVGGAAAAAAAAAGAAGVGTGEERGMSVGGVSGLEALSRGSGGGSSGVGAGGLGGGGGAGGGGGSSSWPDRPLQRQLGVLAELCRSAFGRLQKDVSPTLQLVARMPLLPPPSPNSDLHLDLPDARCGDGGGGGGLSCLQLPQIRTEPPAGKPALIACVLPPAATAAALAAASPPMARGDEAGGLPQQQLHCQAVLLMRVEASTWRPNSLKGQQPPRAQACLLMLPRGMQVLGLSYYRSGQLALLMGPPELEQDPRDGTAAAGGAGGDGVGGAGGGGDQAAAAAGGRANGPGGGGRGGGGGDGGGRVGLLALVPTEGLRMCDVAGGSRAAVEAGKGAEHIVQVCAQSGALEQWPLPGCRLRRAPAGSGWLAPLLVSGPRGLAAAFLQGSRSLMVDLEEDEEGREGGEEDGVEEEEEVSGGGGARSESPGSADRGDQMEEDE